ncbi:hypothetical protein AB0J35_40615 [Nonomuraea angiospora]|uniref:hypothetical protein n=1 Tax=Nonomuraea angiospora TaxID=46172 RepID=UPI00344187CA
MKHLRPAAGELLDTLDRQANRRDRAAHQPAGDGRRLPDIEVGLDAPSILAAYGEHLLNDQQRRVNRLFQALMTNPDER